MLTLRESHQRGKTETDWLESFHTFSFADYIDPAHHHFGPLRVINEDFVAPSSGFGKHPHRDMEIITYIVQGALSHEDSMGNGSTIRPGEIQRMSAGTGVFHGELNHSPNEPVHLLQIWIMPESNNLPPSYEQKKIPTVKNQWILLGSPQGDDQAVIIHQQVKLFSAHLEAKNKLNYEWKSKSQGWLQLIKGELHVNGLTMQAGDGLAIQDEPKINIECNSESEFLLFDLV